MLALLMLVSITGAEPYAYIANYGDGTVSVIDTETNTVTATINVGSGPHGTAITPDGTKVYVSNNYDDTVSVIDTATNTVTATVNVGEFPLGVAVSPDGSKVYVGNLDSKTISIIDTATNTVSMTVNLENNPYLDINAVSPDGTKVYMTFAYGGDSDIYVLDTSTNTITATIDAGQSPDELSAGNSPREIAISPDGTKMYVTNIWYMVNSWELEDYDTYEIGTVSIIDTATNNIIAAVNIGDNPGDNPSGIAITPDGTKVYVANSGSNTVSVIDTETNTITDTLNVGDYPWKVAVNPDGTKVYVANHNSDSISVIDTETNIVTATVTVGSGPLGVAVTPTLEPEIQITKITTSESASDPHIYGDRIVWQDNRDGKSNIYMYDLTTQQETKISTSGKAYYPAIYGDRVVWKDDRNGKSDIYMYDISSCQETQISTNGTAYSTSTLSGPDIYNYKIVWQELGEYTDETNLVMHSLSTQQNTQITTSGLGGVSILGFYAFAIHGDKIVMCSPVGDDCSSIDMYDLSTQKTTWISGGRPLSPEIYDDRIVYEGVSWDYEDLDPYDFYYNIYVYDLSTQQGHQVSVSGTAYNPVIYIDRIVWEDDRSGQNIYMYDISNSKETQITTSGSAYSPDIYGDRIVWVDGGDIYMGTLDETIVSEIGVSDNRLREASPDVVYETSSFIDVGRINGVGRYRDVMQFDLSEYTTDSQISNAVLSLYWYYPAGETRPEDTVIEVYRPASAWNPSYVSWDKKDKNVAWKNAGGDWYDKNGVLQGNTPYATITIKGSNLPDNKYYKLDVTNLVKEYVSGKYENTGFLIKARKESNNYVAFYSSDCGNENQVPELQLTYS